MSALLLVFAVLSVYGGLVVGAIKAIEWHTRKQGRFVS